MTASERYEQQQKEKVQTQLAAAEAIVQRTTYGSDIGFQVVPIKFGLRPYQKPGSTLTLEQYEQALESLNLKQPEI